MTVVSFLVTPLFESLISIILSESINSWYFSFFLYELSDYYRQMVDLIFRLFIEKCHTFPFNI